MDLNRKVLEWWHQTKKYKPFITWNIEKTEDLTFRELSIIQKNFYIKIMTQILAGVLEIIKLFRKRLDDYSSPNGSMILMPTEGRPIYKNREAASRGYND